jgi:hypothetical protein
MQKTQEVDQQQLEKRQDSCHWNLFNNRTFQLMSTPQKGTTKKPAVKQKTPERQQNKLGNRTRTFYRRVRQAPEAAQAEKKNAKQVM